MSEKILLVDDSNTMRRIQKNTLTKIGYNDIDEAGDGAEALKKLETTKYSVVLLDWNMPVMTGIECLKNSPPQSGLVSFYPQTGKDAQKIVSKLETKKFYLRTLANPYCMRACVHYLTLKAEIDALIQAIQDEN